MLTTIQIAHMVNFLYGQENMTNITYIAASTIILFYADIKRKTNKNAQATNCLRHFYRKNHVCFGFIDNYNSGLFHSANQIHMAFRISMHI